MERMGIYMIENTVNNKVYIGSSVDTNNRINNHKNDLNKNKHHNKYLQRAWKKYGADNFTFTVIEKVNDRDKLIEREQYWMDYYNVSENGYNINPTAGSQLGRKLSEDSKNKIYESFPRKKPIVQLDVNGILIDRFPTVKVASMSTGFGIGMIKSCWVNKTFFEGYAWVLEVDYFSNEFDLNQYSHERIQSKREGKSVVSINEFGNIEEFNSMRKAALKFGIEHHGISECCKGKRLTYKSRIWRFKDDFNPSEFTEEYLNSILN